MPSDIVRAVEVYQDWDCLLRMGRSMGSRKDQKELNKLEVFLEKYHNEELTPDDVKNLKIKLEIGAIECTGFAEGDEVEKLRKDGELS